jgi:hypothetical protein
MDVHDPNGLELWRERRAGLQREAESHRLSRRSRAAPRGKFARHPGRVRRPGYRTREAPRILGEAT